MWYAQYSEYRKNEDYKNISSGLSQLKITFFTSLSFKNVILQIKQHGIFVILSYCYITVPPLRLLGF
jgi:hypothetical protein